MSPSLSPAFQRIAGSFAIALSVMVTQNALAFTPFSEDFESYVAGSDLIGQGGWVSGFPGSVTPVMAGTYLSGNVLDGRTGLGGAENVVGRDIDSLDPDQITVLSFDAYATTDSPRSDNTTIYLGDDPGTGITRSLGWVADNQSGPGWIFAVDNFVDFAVAGGYDTPVTMRVVVDGIANETYGTYDFGSGPLETPRFAVTDADIALFDSLYIYFDHRAVLGMEIDNISVAPVPVPAAALLLGSGLACLFGGIRRRPPVWARRSFEYFRMVRTSVPTSQIIETPALNHIP